jgi:DNA-binding response OmpR family regulator
MAQQCVLIVEADLPVRHPVAEYLRGCGYQVLEAVNADEAKILLTRKADIDVVLIGGGGADAGTVFALAQWIRIQNHGAKVLTAATIQKTVEAAGKLCDEGPKIKPYHPQQLHEEIKRLLAAHQRSNDAE